LVLAAIICIGWSMWVRWTTWSCQWERASTVAVTLLGAGVVLTATPVWHLAAAMLHWNVPDGAGLMIGHICLMFAASAIAIAAASRISLRGEPVTRSTIMRWVI